MKIIGAFVLIVFAFLVQVSFSSAQDLILQMKNIYGYDGWPGKAGTLKQEPSLNSADIPKPILVDNTRDSEGTTYLWGATPEKAQVSATVKAYSTIEEAQAGLINILCQFPMILPKAETQGFKVGDVGFAIKEGDAVKLVVFVKNNITVVVKNNNSDKVISVSSLSALIDSII